MRLQFIKDRETWYWCNPETLSAWIAISADSHNLEFMIKLIIHTGLIKKGIRTKRRVNDGSGEVHKQESEEKDTCRRYPGMDVVTPS